MNMNYLQKKEKKHFQVIRKKPKGIENGIWTQMWPGFIPGQKWLSVLSLQVQFAFEPESTHRDSEESAMKEFRAPGEPVRP